MGVLVILSAILVIPLKLVPETAKAQGAMEDDWPMFRHDMNRTGNTSARAPNTNNILWTHQTPWTRYTWGYAGSPAVADGLVFQGSSWPNVMRAIDVETGIQSWQTPTNRIDSSPTVANDHVFFGDYSQRIISLRTDTGAEEWATPVGDWIDGSPVVYDGKVYIGIGIGDYVPSKLSLFYCLDEITGNVIWTFQASGQIVASPTVVNDQIIFGSYDGNIYALPTEDPNGDGVVDMTEIIWIHNLGARVASSAAVEDGVVYVGSLNGKLYALPFSDPNGDGTITEDEVVWKFTAGNEIWSSPGIAHGRVFIGSHDYHLYALPKEDPNGDGIISGNEIIWKFKTTDKIWSSPSIAGGKVFVGSEDYTVWALNEETGAYIWSYEIPLQVDPYGSEYLYASPTIVDGKVFIGNFDLTLYCFGVDDDIPPGITIVNPTNNSLDVPLNANIEATFNETLTSALVTDNSIILESSTGQRTTGKATYNDVTSTLVFNPDADLEPAERYTVRLRSRYFQDDAGNTLDGNSNGILDLEPEDDYVWYFNTSQLVGHKPYIENANVTPQQSYLDTDFEFTVTYYDEDNDAPTDPNGYIKIFIDGVIVGTDMEWANDTNTPEHHLLDRDYTNGELFRYNTQLDFVGGHIYYIECSDGSNTNRTPDYFLPTVLNAPPVLSIPTQYVDEDEEHQLNITMYASDIDNDPLSLLYTEDSDYCQVVSGYILSCLFTTDGLLSSKVNVTANDGQNQVDQEVLFIINPVDDAPTLKPSILRLPLVTVYEETVYIFKLDEYITDQDTPMEQLEVSDDSLYTNPVGLDLYMVYANGTSYENVTLTVTDGTSVLQLYLEVNVLPSDDTPPPTQPPAEDELWALLLAIILITIIIILILINLWILYRRRQKVQNEVSPKEGDEQ